MDKVMKLAKKLGVEDDFKKYCEDNGMEMDADSLKQFLKAEGYSQEDLKEMLAKRPEMEEESEDDEESDEEKKGMSITIAVGKMPPAWS